jgi:hypothetical protein
MRVIGDGIGYSPDLIRSKVEGHTSTVEELMSAAPAYSFAYDDDDLVIRVPRDVISPDKVSRFFDYLLLEEVSRELNFSQEEITALSDEVDKVAWERLRLMVEEKLRGR